MLNWSPLQARYLKTFMSILARDASILTKDFTLGIVGSLVVSDKTSVFATPGVTFAKIVWECATEPQNVTFFILTFLPNYPPISMYTTFRWKGCFGKKHEQGWSFRSCSQTLRRKRNVWYHTVFFLFAKVMQHLSQGRSQPHSPGWARVPLSLFLPQIWIDFSYFSSNFTYFLPHFGPPGGWVTHLGRPWLCHW